MLKGEAYLPDYIFESILDITPAFLKSHGIKGILCDSDNTLAYDNRKEVLPSAADWINSMQAAGIKICLMSNGYLVRNMPVIKKLGLKIWNTRSHKPRKFGYKKCCKKLGLDKSEVAMIGDQMKTDIRGANNFNILSLYVMPFAFETNPFYKNIFKKRRAIERKYFKMYNSLNGTKFDFPDIIKAEMYEEDLKECVY